MTEALRIRYEDDTKPLSVQKPTELKRNIVKKFTLGALYNLARQMEMIHEDIITICPKKS